MIQITSIDAPDKFCHGFAFYVSYNPWTAPKAVLYGRSSYVKQKDPANATTAHQEIQYCICKSCTVSLTDLAFLRSYYSDLFSECSMWLPVNFLHRSFGCCRVLCQTRFRASFGSRSHRTGYKPTTTGGAHIHQYIVHAVCAKSTFVRADACFSRIWRQ